DEAVPAVALGENAFLPDGGRLAELARARRPDAAGRRHRDTGEVGGGEREGRGDPDGGGQDRGEGERGAPAPHGAEPTLARPPPGPRPGRRAGGRRRPRPRRRRRPRRRHDEGSSALGAGTVEQAGRIGPPGDDGGGEPAVERGGDGELVSVVDLQP